VASLLSVFIQTTVPNLVDLCHTKAADKVPERWIPLIIKSKYGK